MRTNYFGARSHFTIKQTANGKKFQLRLFMSDRDAMKYRHLNRPVLCTETGAEWFRGRSDGQVKRKRVSGGWVYDCTRANCYSIRYIFDLKPGERLYYPVRVHYNGADVEVRKPTTEEQLEKGIISPERG